MDFHALSRRELQALCKRNAVRANMSNAAMANALQALPSVEGIDEIGRAAAPPISAMKSVDEVIVEEEKKHGSPTPCAGRARSKARTAVADKMDEGEGSEGAAAREAVAPVDVEEVIGEKQGHGCPLPRGARARVKTRKASAPKTEVALLAPDTLQENQGTATAAEGEGMAPVDAENVAIGKGRTRRSTRSKVKMALGQEEEVTVEIQKEKAFGSLLVVSDKSCNDPKEDEVVVVEDEATKPEEGHNVTRRPAAHEAEEEVPVPAILWRSQRTVAPVGMAPVEAEEVATGKRRTRRSAKSRVKMALDQTEVEGATIWKESKVSDKSCDDPKMHEVVVVVEEITKDHNVTRRPAAHEMEEVPAPAILRRSQRTAAPVEVEEVATTKKRTRRSTRSKVAVAAQKGQKADSSDGTIGSADKRSDDPKEYEVVAVVEEETTNTDKMEEVPVPGTLQKNQMTAAPEAVVPVEAEDRVTTKRRRRPRRKVAAAARNGQKAESSDAAIGSSVFVIDQSSDALREDQLVVMVEEHVTEPQEGIVEEEEQCITIHKSASSVKMENPPNVSVLSKPEATDISDNVVAAVEETVKKDCFTLTAKADQSDLLVNTLDRFSKPMYEFTDKGEKKESECWWMLM
ncbi:unnamed protein product [Urochloa decumbens]|uniref:Uncharacterized protein n=1 Tax=Urochloa decumbens TaxID=240449 RepID=A0ABC8YYG5_9POAL